MPTLYGISVKIPIQQIGGIITTIVTIENKAIRRIQITGAIEITAEGMAHINIK